MSRRAFLGAAGTGLAALGLGGYAQAQGAGPRPNVVLVMTDDQGYGDLSCHGNDVLPTPNLDRLYRESVRLTNFHVSPTCAPTRAALMTGRYNNRTGVWHTIMGRSLLRRDEVTMADHFSKAGYRTGIFGKWHLGDNYPYRPEDRGFQEVLVHGGGGVGQTPDYWGNTYEDDTYFHNGTAKPFPGYCTDVWFNGAIDFVKSAPDTPFFCYLPTNVPHGPYIVPEVWKKPFEGKGLKANQVAFYGMLAHFDHSMGRLLKALDDSGLADNTILIFMTDNGTSAGDRGGMRGAKGSEYEGGHRVPCFVRWPKGALPAGTDCPHLTSHIDLLPTLLELCGLPTENPLSFDGMSLVPWLKEPERRAPERVIVADSQRIDHPEKWRKSAVMDGDWRLVNGKELYDLGADPEQKKDIAAEHPDVVARLTKAYDAWWASTSERFDEYCPMVVGAAGQGVSHLTCHDWHAHISEVPWNQPHIRAGKEGNGFWVVDVEQAGDYAVALRRWPHEANTPIRGAVEGGTAIPIKEARVEIAGVSDSKAVSDGDVAAEFTLKLPQGEHRLQTAFLDENGVERGSYYVSIERVSA